MFAFASMALLWKLPVIISNVKFDLMMRCSDEEDLFSKYGLTGNLQGYCRNMIYNKVV